MLMQSPPAVWILHWYEGEAPGYAFGYRFVLHSPVTYDHEMRTHHIWNCTCEDCARESQWQSWPHLDTWRDEPHWNPRRLKTDESYICFTKRLVLFPVWYERLKNKTLDHWLEEDVKDLDLPLPIGVVRIVAAYALEPVIPGTSSAKDEPPIFLDSDKLVDIRVLDDTCESKECTCKKVNPSQV
jgi:hypothetical protein